MLLRCMRCRADSALEDNEAVDCCPVCGASDLPGDASDLVSLSLTWHEWRIVAMWASNFAEIIDKPRQDAGLPSSATSVVYGITDEMHQQGGLDRPPLTMRGELAMLRATAQQWGVEMTVSSSIFPEVDLP